MSEDGECQDWQTRYADLPVDGVTCWGIRVIGYIDRDGDPSVMWVMDGEAGIAEMVGGIEMMKLSMIQDMSKRYRVDDDGVVHEDEEG